MEDLCFNVIVFFRLLYNSLRFLQCGIALLFVMEQMRGQDEEWKKVREIEKTGFYNY